ncbi:MAG: hypothetical protein ACOWWH_12475 [Eubacteriaceae bacterium]
MEVKIYDNDDNTELIINDWYDDNLLPVTISNKEIGLRAQINMTKKDVYHLMLHLQNRLNEL